MSELKTIKFMSFAKLAAAASILLLVVSIGSLATRGLNLGLDFTGGTSIELEYEEAPSLDAIREQLVAAGYESAIVVAYGSDKDVMVRIQGDAKNLGEDVGKVGDAIDCGTGHSMAGEYVQPLRGVACAMTDNLLTKDA